MGGGKRCFALLPLMLLTLLLLPTRMVAQGTTEDQRCELFNSLDGITDVTITDNGSYPWQMLNLKAEGMENFGFNIPDGSPGLMSSNYHVNNSTSEIVVKFIVEKPILLTFKYLVSSDSFDKATVTLDNKAYGTISGKNQIEVKALLPIGEHSLTLSYKKDGSGNNYADRAIIYDLKTSTTIDDYVAEYDAANYTLTFKKISSDNLGILDLKNIVIANNELTVSNICSRLGIDKKAIKNAIFEKSFNTYALTSLNNFFSNCSGLKTITGLDNLNTAKVTDMSYMFKNCYILPSLNLSNFNTAEVTNMSYMFGGCYKLSSLTLSESFNAAKVTNMSNMFNNCQELPSLDLSKFNTANVTDMSYMFYECQKLSSLTLSESFNTENVTDMSYMFYDCKKLSSLDLSNFNTTKVKNMSNMFNNCQELPSLDLSKFNTAIVTDMSNMFCNCYKLSSLTLSESFNTAKVTDMSSMFRYCENLSSLALSKFNTAKVWNMSYMFRDCKKISSLDLSNFNTTKVKYMQFMFDNCQELSSLTLSESFNTAKVTDMSDMFRYCKKLSSLDLSNFNTANVTNMSSMFYGCSTLQTIYVSENFVVTGITDESLKVNLFTGCKALKGAIPEYNSAKTSSDYANYKTGYFTKLVVRNGNERYGITGETTQLTVDNLVLADNKDLVVFDPFTATAASYNRTMEGTTWGTLCLPFEVSLDEQNFRAFELGSVSNNEVVLKELNTTIPAGTPVFIKMNEGATSLNFSVADKAIAKDVKTGATEDNLYQLVGLYATKMFDKTDNNCYILKNGKLMNPAKILNGTSGTEAVGSKPFRAYMVDKNPSASGAKMFSISENGSDPTGIDQLTDTLNDSNAVYYDLQGHRLSQPQKGINILKVGNKTMKVIIK